MSEATTYALLVVALAGGGSVLTLASVICFKSPYSELNRIAVLTLIAGLSTLAIGSGLWLVGPSG